MTSELAEEQKRANTIAAIVQSLNEQIELAAQEGLKTQIDIEEPVLRVVEIHQVPGEQNPITILIPIYRIKVQVWKAM